MGSVLIEIEKEEDCFESPVLSPWPGWSGCLVGERRLAGKGR